MKTIVVNVEELPARLQCKNDKGEVAEYVLRPAGRKLGVLLNKPEMTKKQPQRGAK